MNKIIVIYGATAIGKSDIAVRLAQIFDAEIISADSMQIYKDLNIGSAKITKEEMQGIPHHLIDIKDCTQEYSVYDFVRDCKVCIKDIKSRGKNVIICGGTGLYIKALVNNYTYNEIDKNKTKALDLQSFSTKELCKMLENLGYKPKQDDKNNKRRLIHYIEIYSQNKQLKKDTTQAKDYILFGLALNREELYKRINARVDKMINSGLIEETKYLLSKASPFSQSMKAIGYKELIPYILGECSLEECVNLLKQKTRNYAKRQITFMNQFNDIIKVEVKTKQQAVNEIANYINKQNDIL